jgi:hypothetical protein
MLSDSTKNQCISLKKLKAIPILSMSLFRVFSMSLTIPTTSTGLSFRRKSATILLHSFMHYLTYHPFAVI